MTVAREQVMAALFTALSNAVYSDGTSPVFNSVSRKLKLWGEVPHDQQPAMFLVDTHETRTQQPPQGLPSKLLMRTAAIIYVSTTNSEDVPSVQMNLVLDAVDKVFLPDDLIRNVFTLGGLVHYCRIEGNIAKTPGDLDGQGMAVIPINVMLP